MALRAFAPLLALGAWLGGTACTARTVAQPLVLDAGNSSGPTALPATTTFGPVLDDMSGATQTGGNWYTYSDRTVLNSEPPINTTPPAPGSVTPAEGDAFPQVMPGRGTNIPPLAYRGAPVFVREGRARGETTWGAGFALDLWSEVPDGAPVAVNMCGEGVVFVTDGGPVNVGIPQPIDASMYKGFSFWGISLSGRALDVEVQIADDQTSP